MRGFLTKSLPAVAMAALFLSGGSAASGAYLRAPGGGTVRALVIGIDKYGKLGEGAQLHGAEADGADIRAALEKGGVNAKFLPDGQATRQAVVTEMNALVNAAKPGDLVLISYAGHGMRTPEYPKWKGLSRDGASEQMALSNFSFSGAGAGEVIVKIELRAWLSRLEAKGIDTLVVMDSCFGGGMMRSVDHRAGELRVRAVNGAPDSAERDKFAGIEMNEREKRADIEAMPHVTFLGGATSESVVPEMPINGSPIPRGALSYFVARALEGQGPVKGTVTRRNLFEYVFQNVQEATKDRQLPAISPGSEDDAVLDKPVFVLADGPAPAPSVTPAPVASAPPALVTPPTPAPSVTPVASAPPAPVTPPTPAPVVTPAPAAAVDGVRLTVIDGPPDSFAKIDKGATPLIETPNRDAAELIWDVGKGDALSLGDLVMQNVDGSMIPFVADRTWALRKLHQLSQSRVLPINLASGGKSLTQGETAEVVATGLRGQHMTAFNITADGQLQMIHPSATPKDAACPAPSGDGWTCPLQVTPPYGADTMVALTTADDPTEFIAWLKSHKDPKRDAALLPAEIARVFEADPSARLGFVGVFTNARSN